MALLRQHPLNQDGGSAHTFGSVRLPRLQEPSRKPCAERSDSVEQARTLRTVGPLHVNTPDACLFPKFDDERDVDQLVSVVDFRLGLNLCLEVSVFLEKVLQG